MFCLVCLEDSHSVLDTLLTFGSNNAIMGENMRSLSQKLLQLSRIVKYVDPDFCFTFGIYWVHKKIGQPNFWRLLVKLASFKPESNFYFQWKTWPSTKPGEIFKSSQNDMPNCYHFFVVTNFYVFNPSE